MTNLINKIKLIWKGRSIATNLVNIKSRWKEPTFWVALLSQVITVLGYAQGLLEPKIAMIITTVTTSLYNYMRGLQKAQSDGVKPYASRSEFILGLAAMAQNCFMGLHEQGLNPAWLVGTTIILGHAITAAEALQNMRPKEVADAGVTGATPKPA